MRVLTRMCYMHVLYAKVVICKLYTDSGQVPSFST